MKALCVIALALVMSSVDLAAASSLDAFLISGFPYAEFDELPATLIVVGSSNLRVGFARGPIALPRERILGWIKKSADAVLVYYGHFPVAAARVLIVPAARKRIKGGQAFGYPYLPKLWNELGIKEENGIISFNDQAPPASIRRAITAREALSR